MDCFETSTEGINGGKYLKNDLLYLLALTNLAPEATDKHHHQKRNLIRDCNSLVIAHLDITLFT
jgi:hypothetical protein